MCLCDDRIEAWSSTRSSAAPLLLHELHFEQQRLRDDESILNHVRFFIGFQVRRMDSPIPVFPQLVAHCDKLRAREFFSLHHLDLVVWSVILRAMLVGEDAEGPFENDAALTPYCEESRLVVLLHQVEGE